MLRVFKESGRPLPKFSDDDVIDYMVIEALVVKEGKEIENAEKARKRAEWKSNRDHLKGL